VFSRHHDEDNLNLKVARNTDLAAALCISKKHLGAAAAAAAETIC
jgi:hypothetical protein